jgi:hypothetical protein
MNNSQDLIYNVNFSREFSINYENRVINVLIDDKNINEPNICNSNTPILIEDHNNDEFVFDSEFYICISGISMCLIILLIIYLFVHFY